MPHNSDDKNYEGAVSRRTLLGRGSVLALGLLVGGAQGLHAEELVPTTFPRLDNAPEPPAAPVGIAVIGLGEQGREIAKALHYVPGANVLYLCDTYPKAVEKAQESHPKAKGASDYRTVLDDKAVQAVYVATPSHLHKQIVLDALSAGKHVYCEVPLAHTVDDARVMARAAKASPQLIFHSGLQQRTNPQHNHVLGFVRAGALAKIAQSKSQWHKKTSWRRAAPTDDRQAALNWRLSKATSPGLMGEIGIHQVDVTNWFLKKNPITVTGFGAISAWRDGRDVPDTVQAIFEYSEGTHLAYDATLANSFDGAYELFQGTDAAVLLRDGRAWMFKEADAPELGWEVYAYKEKIGDETGIALVADATKLLAAGLDPSKNRDTDPTKGSLYFASVAFLDGIRSKKPTVCGAQEGFVATVSALKANEAITTGTRITLAPELFTV